MASLRVSGGVSVSWYHHSEKFHVFSPIYAFGLFHICFINSCVSCANSFLLKDNTCDSDSTSGVLEAIIGTMVVFNFLFFFTLRLTPKIKMLYSL